MNMLRKLVTSTAMRFIYPFSRQTKLTVSPSRKQELMDLALTLMIGTLIVIYKINKES